MRLEFKIKIKNQIVVESGVTWGNQQKKKKLKKSFYSKYIFKLIKKISGFFHISRNNP